MPLCWKVMHYGDFFKCFVSGAMGLSLEARVERYCDAMVATMMHADRKQPGRWYLKGLVLPEGRKSVEPMAARVSGRFREDSPFAIYRDLSAPEAFASPLPNPVLNLGSASTRRGHQTSQAPLTLVRLSTFRKAARRSR